MRRTLIVRDNHKKTNPFHQHSTWSIVRGLIVFRLCKVPNIVERARKWLERSEAVFRHDLTYHTFAKWFMFDHFCAGRDRDELRVICQDLARQGVGSILDYAAEAAIDAKSTNKKKKHSDGESSSHAVSTTTTGTATADVATIVSPSVSDDPAEVDAIQKAIRNVVDEIRRNDVSAETKDESLFFTGAWTPVGMLPIDPLAAEQALIKQKQEDARTKKPAPAKKASRAEGKQKLERMEQAEEDAEEAASARGGGESAHAAVIDAASALQRKKMDALERKVKDVKLQRRTEWEPKPEHQQQKSAAATCDALEPPNMEAIYYASARDVAPTEDTKPAHEMNRNVDLFITSISDASEMRSFRMPVAFAAIKLTALADPLLLARVNSVLLGVRRDWLHIRTPAAISVHNVPLQQCRVLLLGNKKLQEEMYRATHDEFRNGLRQKYVAKEGAAATLRDEHIDVLLQALDPTDKGFVDYLTYVQLAADAILDVETYRDDPEIFASQQKFTQNVAATAVPSNGGGHSGGGGAKIAAAETAAIMSPTKNIDRPLVFKILLHLHRGLHRVELDQLRQFHTRGEAVIQHGVRRRVRVMVDAEQSYYQMAIDQFTREMQRKYNRTEPVVLNTYQAYMETSEARVVNDLRRAKREGWVWAGKVVRGAYIKEETVIALKYNYRNPIWPSIELTHRCYNRIADRLLTMCQKQPDVPYSILFGSHNASSVYYISTVVANMPPHCKCEISFAQLLGMADDLTLYLARNGHRVFKYLPYGPVKETLAYLMRRAEENSSILAGPNPGIAHMKAELAARVTRAVTIIVVTSILIWIVWHMSA